MKKHSLPLTVTPTLIDATDTVRNLPRICALTRTRRWKVKASFLFAGAVVAMGAPEALAPEPERAVVIPRTVLASRIGQELALAMMFRVGGNEMAAIRFEGRADVYRELLGFLDNSTAP